LEEDKQLSYTQKALLILTMVAPLFLLVLPANHFDSGESLCLSVRLFDKECFGCGITRAIMHLIHFDFAAAWSYNKLSFIILPGMIMFWFYLLGKLINKKIFRFFDRYF
jgi:hypothetical protein